MIYLGQGIFYMSVKLLLLNQKQGKKYYYIDNRNLFTIKKKVKTRKMLVLNQIP